MVRFLCFNTHIHSHKPKKAVESSQEEMRKTLEDHTKVITSHEATSLDTSLIVKPLASSMSATRATESEEIEKEKFNLVKDTSFYQTGLFRKSQSTGSGLCMEGRIPFDNYEEDETECGLSSDSRDKNGLEALVSSKYGGIASQSLYQDGACSDSVQISSYHVENGSIFSIGDIQNSEHGVHENSESPISGKYGISVECADASAGLMHHTEPVIAKSHSLPNLVTSVLSPSEYSPNLKSHSRSSEDLHVLGMQKKEISTHEIDVDSMRDQQTDTKGHQPEKSCFEIANSEAHYSHSYSALAQDWMIPVTDETHTPKTAREDSCGWNWDEMTSKDFKIKRIEEWVNDCQHYCQLEECESSNSNDEVKHEFTTLNPGTAVKDNLRASPGMDAAKRYISSLSASATTAQIANHGLVVIPFLSAFVSLRILNLSGNNIAKITSGALPRGLHMLNLAKNNISSIEGLRELTRLRVLDLSYNRIFKIGHGLASCSSLKELYLAGNKISEVEGLHRLLKLTVLDLRFNKLSTAKCLGQLAANFNSLQAISLEGNPAQKNVGDEQIKKYLQGLLPHLTYFNRQPVKAGTSKDSTDCLRRLGISGHHFDRGRSENKASRKGNHLASQKTAISSPSRRSQVQAVASPKHSRGRHGHGPASGSKGPNSRPQQYDASGKLLILKSEVSMRRARSEGMFTTL